MRLRVPDPLNPAADLVIVAGVTEIRDPIHGSIVLDAREREVVDSPFFQRLRSVRQLGFADLAFPGATHTRYVHALGACHLSGRIFEAIFRRLPEIPERERTAKGMPIVNLLPLQAGEKIQAIIDTRDYESHRYLFFATKQGQVKKTKFTEYDSSLRAGLIAINLRDDDELVRVIPTNGGDDIFMVSRDGMTIRFSEDEVRPMGRSAAGVRGMKLKAGADDAVASRSSDEPFSAASTRPAS